MSPLLFALYVDPITQELQKLNRRKEEEPSMILFADDMVVWGQSAEELEEKMNAVARETKNLGLMLSMEKTEVQHNKNVKPSMEDKEITLKTCQKYRYKKMNEPLRYLGTWSTANMEKEWGLHLLRKKMQERLSDIREVRLNPVHKMNLTRGRVVSMWDYTMAIQTMEEDELEEWDKKMAEAILGNRGERRMRREMLWEEKGRGGLGMVKMTEELKVNRARTMVQIMKGGERIQEEIRYHGHKNY